MSLFLGLLMSLVGFVLVCILVGFVLVCILVGLLPSLRYSAAIRTLEAACGLVAALVGCLVLAFTLFGPTYSFQSCSGYGNDSGNFSSCQTGTANLLQVGIPPSAIVALCILLLGLIGVAVSAVVHSRTGDSGWDRALGINRCHRHHDVTYRLKHRPVPAPWYPVCLTRLRALSWRE
jgi:hypothetical protein